MSKPSWSLAVDPKHKRQLARLVGIYGRDAVAREAMTVPLPRPRGQPRKSMEDKFLQMITAQLIEEAIGFAREAGESRPAEAVARAFYNRSPDDPNVSSDRDRLSQWRYAGNELLRKHGDDPCWHEWRDRFYDLTVPELEAIYKKDDAKTKMGIWYIWREFYAAAVAKRGEI